MYVSGFGMSLILSPSMAIVQLYFDKRRAVAAGIASAGLSCSLLIMPVVTQYLLDHYTLQQVLLLLIFRTDIIHFFKFCYLIPDSMNEGRGGN